MPRLQWRVTSLFGDVTFFFAKGGRSGEDEIPRRCACGISGPPAGVRATPLGSCSRRSFGPLGCFRRPAPDVSKLPPGPVNENSQLLSQPAVSHIFAERARFELAIPFWGTHAFQACLFSHSSISPIRIPGNRDCKGNHFFRKCKCRRLNFSTGDYKVRLWSMQPGYSSG